MWLNSGVFSTKAVSNSRETCCFQKGGFLAFSNITVLLPLQWDYPDSDQVPIVILAVKKAEHYVGEKRKRKKTYQSSNCYNFTIFIHIKHYRFPARLLSERKSLALSFVAGTEGWAMLQDSSMLHHDSLCQSLPESSRNEGNHVPHAGRMANAFTQPFHVLSWR